ncbi:hypothetical protein Pyrfu_1377 [Pyrolobus fumarii 1A]|uniref:Uncharacterized protein n=1 Tax=Pyrolobus fumarii (strain DSM 11204 / 1A) TaxID=694429 RepID=G0EGT7_PYRF1|nr:hypothetical protein [Pyrolobus fumarii]AEM39235.1 hypothetical protein Pyrfu_1377 [Pyrolobus fumarii 1A]
MKTLVVYHEPGVRGSERILEKLLALLDSLGLKARLSPLKESIVNRCWNFERIYLLMFGRGGHWLELRDACNTEPRILPPLLVAEGVASVTRPGSSIVLVYRRARRNNVMYTRDIMNIVNALRALGRRALPLEASRALRLGPYRADYVVPLALLPGSLAEHAARIARVLNAEPLPPFAVYAIEHIAAWIASEAIQS